MKSLSGVCTMLYYIVLYMGTRVNAQQRKKHLIIFPFETETHEAGLCYSMCSCPGELSKRDQGRGRHYN